MKRAALMIEERHCLAVRVARSIVERSRGLSHQQKWDGTPMAFLFRRPCRPAFWMHGVRFPLDLIWVHKGKIVGITPDVRPAISRQVLYNMLFLERHRPPEKVDMVIEMLSGESVRLGLQQGQRVMVQQ